MPEGPEVRREADRIASVLVRQPLEGVYFGQAHMAGCAGHLIDAQVMAVNTHGKAMLTHFNNGYSVYSHNQLYGKWVVVRKGQEPKTNRQLRFCATHEITQCVVVQRIQHRALGDR